MIQFDFDEIIFQMGWFNHQRVICCTFQHPLNGWTFPDRWNKRQAIEPEALGLGA